VVLDCTVMPVDPAAESIDGNCDGIAHVPNGLLRSKATARSPTQKWTITRSRAASAPTRPTEARSRSWANRTAALTPRSCSIR